MIGLMMITKPSRWRIHVAVTWLGIVVASLFGLEALADQVADRLQPLIEQRSGYKTPDPSKADPWALATFALASLYSGKDVALANDCVAAYCSRNPIGPFDPGNLETLDGFPGYFPLQLMWRLYLLPKAAAHLNESNCEAIRQMMWSWIETRSRLTDAQGSVWRISGSENHDAMQKSGYLLCAQALARAGSPWGPQRRLKDGHTLEEHTRAWTKYWFNYFGQRAREGINCEIASPIYAKYSVGCYYNVRDFARSAQLRRRAEDFLHLYWADSACEFLPNGVRGGAQTRVYKNDYLYQGTRYAFHALGWGYGWREGEPGNLHPYALLPATSSYRVPDIITACAADHHRPGYLYSSRRFGMGDWKQRVYTIEFDPDQTSNLRRDSYVTSDYVLGTLTLDPAREYNLLIDQNRTMGVCFASSANDRIIIHGRADDRSQGRTGWAEINGVCGRNAMLVWRDPNARDSIGTRIFVSQGEVWNNLGPGEDGWFFTRSGNAYCAIKIAHGGYTTNVVKNRGVMIDLEDMWSPVIIQMGQAADFAGGLNHFQKTARSNSVDYDDATGRVKYTSSAGDVYEVWRQSKAVPHLNGKPVNLNPPKTYDSPYLQMIHGDARAQFSYRGFADLELDFSSAYAPEKD